MLEELERRNFTDSTRRAYFRIIEDFALHFHRRPGTHPRIHYSPVSRQETLRQLGPSNSRSFAILLRQDAEAALARGGNALPEEENASALDFEPG